MRDYRASRRRGTEHDRAGRTDRPADTSPGRPDRRCAVRL